MLEFVLLIVIVIYLVLQVPVPQGVRSTVLGRQSRVWMGPIAVGVSTPDGLFQHMQGPTSTYFVEHHLTRNNSSTTYS